MQKVVHFLFDENNLWKLSSFTGTRGKVYEEAMWNLFKTDDDASQKFEVRSLCDAGCLAFPILDWSCP